jgi:hypothetical protein
MVPLVNPPLVVLPPVARPEYPKGTIMTPVRPDSFDTTEPDTPRDSMGGSGATIIGAPWGGGINLDGGDPDAGTCREYYEGHTTG